MMQGNPLRFAMAPQRLPTSPAGKRGAKSADRKLTTDCFFFSFP